MFRALCAAAGLRRQSRPGRVRSSGYSVDGQTPPTSLRSATSPSRGGKSASRCGRMLSAPMGARKFFHRGVDFFSPEAVAEWEQKGGGRMGRPKKYNGKKLQKAVERYFQRITTEQTVTVPRETGEKDKYGHNVVELVPAVNQLGEELTETFYLIPPTIGGLCIYLGISGSTWAEYAGEEEFSETVTYARGRIQAYLQQELLTRPGRDVKGIMFDLQNNHGYREKVDVSTREQELAMQEKELKIKKLEAELAGMQEGSHGKEIEVTLEGELSAYAQ